MIEDRDIELVHAALDGELSEADRADLDRRIAREPAVRAYQEQLEYLLLSMRASRAPDAPDDLKARIMADIPAAPGASRQAANDGRWRAPAALAAALALAVGVTFMLTPAEIDRLDEDEMAGTVAGKPFRTSSSPRPTVSVAPDLDAYRVQGPDFVTDVRVDWLGDQLRVELDLEAGAALQAEVSLAEPAEPVTVTLDAGQPQELRLEAFSGPWQGPLHLTFSRDGQEVYRARVAIPPPE